MTKRITIVTGAIKNGKPFILSSVTRNMTKAEIEADRLKELKRRVYLDRTLEQAEILECDKCKTKIGYVYANDLEGSYFYCKNCKQK